MNADYTKEYLSQLNKTSDLISPDEVEKIAQVIFQAYKNNKQIFVIGNGGSAANASHLATDLGKSTVSDFSDLNEKRYKVISLTDNVPYITAYANDLSYDKIFSQQLRNLANEGDVLVAFTGSGNSKNIVKALEMGRDLKTINIGLLGFDGGKCKDLCEHKIIVQSDNYGIIEDIHCSLLHIIYMRLKELKNNK